MPWALTLDTYGKSIQRDKVESEFGDLLGNLTPKDGLVDVAIHMFKELWTRNVSAVEARTRAAKDGLKAINTKMCKLIDRAMEATSSVIVKAYEEKITALDIDKKVKEEQLKTLLDDAKREVARGALGVDDIARENTVVVIRARCRE